jgi:hypothetical protein
MHRQRELKMSIRRLNVADAPGKVKRAALAMFPGQGLPLRYAGHALQACGNDRYGNLLPHLPNVLSGAMEDIQFVEVEINPNGTTEKVVARLRTPLKCGRDTVDLVLVVLRCGAVVTVWGNTSSDKHRTLNRARLH